MLHVCTSNVKENHLAYARVSWSYNQEFQRKFTRLINDIGTLPYSERLRELRLTTLAERRLRGDLIETFKIVNGLVDYGENIFRLSRSGSNIVSKCHIGYLAENSPVIFVRIFQNLVYPTDDLLQTHCYF